MTEKIKITFLGTSDAIPSAERNHTAIFLNYKEENILVDCGEGSQRQFRKAGLNPGKVNRILITHWHGDHILGLPGLFQTLALSGYNKKLHIYGPRKTKKYIEELLRVFVFVGKLDLEVHEIEHSGKFFENEDFYLEAREMTHGIPCLAYNFVEKDKIRLDKKKLMKTKLPMGPLLGKLKEGKNIFYNGKNYKAKDFIYSEKGRKISFVLDTGMNSKIAEFVKDSELLVIESNYSSDEEEKAKEHLHMTSKQVAEISKKAKVKKLILTHISQRYEKDKNKLLNEAKKIFKNSFLVRDLEVVNL